LSEETFAVEGRGFASAGSVAIKMRKRLSELGFPPETIRRVAIITYEAEMNIVLHAERGEMRFRVFRDEIRIETEDSGQGIPDVEMALRIGFSTASAEARKLGFGAGMGLPNIRKNSDEFSISSTVDKGTQSLIVIRPKTAVIS